MSTLIDLVPVTSCRGRKTLYVLRDDSGKVLLEPEGRRLSQRLTLTPNEAVDLAHALVVATSATPDEHAQRLVRDSLGINL